VLAARDAISTITSLFVKQSLTSAPVHFLFDSDGDVLDPVPLVARPLPPLLQSAVSERLSDEVPATAEEAYQKNGKFTFLVENIHFNAPLDMPIAGAPPVGPRLFLEFYTSPQRAGDAMTDTPILLQRVEVGPSGRVETDLPAGVPLFEVLRRDDGKIAVGRDRQAFHVGGFNFGQPNTVARCVGCHAGHSMIPVPRDPSWANLAPSALVSFHSGRFRSSTDDRTPFLPQWLVDRSTRNELRGGGGEYGDEPARLSLRFRGRIQGRQVNLHGSGSVPWGSAEIGLAWIHVVSLREGAMQEDILINETPTPHGQVITLDPSLEFDALEVSLSAVVFQGGRATRSTPGLSEIEVIGRSVTSEYSSTIAIVRGDANSDLAIGLSDAVSILGYLFEGRGDLPCAAAADFNDDGGVAIDDAISTLEFLFLGGAAPSAPYPSCGLVPEGALPCEREACL
jgi:hypothetical protein